MIGQNVDGAIMESTEGHRLPPAPALKEADEYEASTKAMNNFNQALKRLSDNLEEMTQSIEQTNTITSAWLSLWHSK
ncbi:hypothetical protein SPRG_05763 [Saprolegnia parasitica CBS 223.65]|uniref:Uncharacterized protein n=1 Tax=Saprolegnia parasitica (strain CBS 223.65) TaxID=695850 RepID=A0A067CPZ8_SAPPC|nr:hypothetical protein SPRG_05763 [Saprolegnia parasitica CBS 223.65]XP_012211423.1 hypothetical protein SPRG_16718 [Saprolegnia parasitica CBS 223.65]KDO17872.1 hypothetical protein SPRG_16718 [Saprolegnia parasitica CBS 223.65]KDO28892.1 hypothetical protein SPRG_05763 [Saprolegnia parasitica CBS 223.65]|eukprot:XP_012200436.1 hypothetical protein SPRG_05763 [Saprolegnia parasitica CBS 223.65]